MLRLFLDILLLVVVVSVPIDFALVLACFHLLLGQRKGILEAFVFISG